MISWLVAASLVAPKIGLQLSAPEGGGENELISAIRDQIRMGLNTAVVSTNWDDMEPTPGQTNWKPLDDGLGVIKFLGGEGLVRFSSIDTVNLRIPKDLAGQTFDSPVMIDRWTQALTAYTKHLPKSVKWVSLGNEVNAYFDSHPGDIVAYTKFLAAGRDAVKAVRSDISVGVTLTWINAHANPAMAKQLMKGMDVAVWTYYPMNGFKMISPSEVPTHFKEMAALSEGKPEYLQEIGYACSSTCGSSPELQSHFVDAVFDELEKTSPIVGAVYFMQYDFTSELMDIFPTYYHINSTEFSEFLGTLGLRDRMGKPRPAWWTFRKRALAFSARNEINSGLN